MWVKASENFVIASMLHLTETQKKLNLVEENMLLNVFTNDGQLKSLSFKSILACRTYQGVTSTDGLHILEYVNFADTDISNNLYALSQEHYRG